MVSLILGKMDFGVNGVNGKMEKWCKAIARTEDVHRYIHIMLFKTH